MVYAACNPFAPCTCAYEEISFDCLEITGATFTDAESSELSGLKPNMLIVDDLSMPDDDPGACTLPNLVKVFAEQSPLDDCVTAECNCEFTPYDDEPCEESFHYKRRCQACRQTWYSLHCPHDGFQSPCPNCGERPLNNPPA